MHARASSRIFAGPFAGRLSTAGRSFAITTALDADDRLPYINLFASANIPAAADTVVGAGAAGVVVDWERRGKGARQAGADTQINADTPAHLAAACARGSERPLARLYVGLNDLRIDRGGGPLFLALVDGTVDRVAAAGRSAWTVTARLRQSSRTLAWAGRART